MRMLTGMLRLLDDEADNQDEEEGEEDQHGQVGRRHVQQLLLESCEFVIDPGRQRPALQKAQPPLTTYIDLWPLIYI